MNGSRLTCAAVGLGLFVLGLAVWRPVPAGTLHDDGVYVLESRAIAEGAGLRYAGVPGAPPAVKFPPLYPAALAVLWKVSPAFPRNVLLFEGWNLVLVALAGALFAWFLLEGLGWPRVPAAAVPVLGLAGVDVWRVAVVPLSEPLFLVLLVASVAAATRIEGEREPPRSAWVWLLVSLALLVHTRTVGVVVAGATAAALLSRSRVRQGLAVAAGSAALLVPWTLWSRAAASGIPEPLRDVLGPYGPWIAAQISADPSAYLGGLGRQAGLLLAHYVTALLPGLPPGVRALALLTVLPVLGLGAAALWTRSRTVVLATAFYLGILWLWPFKEFRLIVPSLPLLALLFGAGAAELHRRHGTTTLGRAGLTFAGAWAAWFVVQTAVGLAGGRHLEGLGPRTRLLSEAVTAVTGRTDRSAVVGAPDLWAALHLYTGRQAAPSARFQPLRTGGAWGTPEEQLRVWEAAGLTHLLQEHGGAVHGAALAALEERCGEGAVRTVAELPGGASLVALPDLEACGPEPGR